MNFNVQNFLVFWYSTELYKKFHLLRSKWDFGEKTAELKVLMIISCSCLPGDKIQTLSLKTVFTRRKVVRLLSLVLPNFSAVGVFSVTLYEERKETQKLEFACFHFFNSATIQNFDTSLKKFLCSAFWSNGGENPVLTDASSTSFAYSLMLASLSPFRTQMQKKREKAAFAGNNFKTHSLFDSVN